MSHEYGQSGKTYRMKLLDMEGLDLDLLEKEFFKDKSGQVKCLTAEK